jgi:hypothetical protein
LKKKVPIPSLSSQNQPSSLEDSIHDQKTFLGPDTKTPSIGREHQPPSTTRDGAGDGSVGARTFFVAQGPIDVIKMMEHGCAHTVYIHSGPTPTGIFRRPIRRIIIASRTIFWKHEFTSRVTVTALDGGKPWTTSAYVRIHILWNSESQDVHESTWTNRNAGGCASGTAHRISFIRETSPELLVWMMDTCEEAGIVLERLITMPQILTNSVNYIVSAKTSRGLG